MHPKSIHSLLVFTNTHYYSTLKIIELFHAGKVENVEAGSVTRFGTILTDFGNLWRAHLVLGKILNHFWQNNVCY